MYCKLYTLAVQAIFWSTAQHNTDMLAGVHCQKSYTACTDLTCGADFRRITRQYGNAIFRVVYADFYARGLRYRTLTIRHAGMETRHEAPRTIVPASRRRGRSNAQHVLRQLLDRSSNISIIRTTQTYALQDDGWRSSRFCILINFIRE